MVFLLWEFWGECGVVELVRFFWGVGLGGRVCSCFVLVCFYLISCGRFFQVWRGYVCLDFCLVSQLGYVFCRVVSFEFGIKLGSLVMESGCNDMFKWQVRGVVLEFEFLGGFLLEVCEEELLFLVGTTGGAGEGSFFYLRVSFIRGYRFILSIQGIQFFFFFCYREFFF